MKSNSIVAILLLLSLPGMAQVNDSLKRKVYLAGAANFRDLGGYPAASGKHVKWGLIYRSAEIGRLQPADLAELEKRKIAYDIDLRGLKEAAALPDKMPPACVYIQSPAGSDSLNQQIMKKLSQTKNGDSLMIAFYAETDHIKARYAPLFATLLQTDSKHALLFHCSAGKDRTGLGAALILTALGVPREIIMQDYLASNYYRQDANKSLRELMVSRMNMPAGVVSSLLSVKPEYLNASFTAIEKRYGSVQKFMESELGLDQNKISRLRALYLE